MEVRIMLLYEEDCELVGNMDHFKGHQDKGIEVKRLRLMKTIEDRL